MVLSFSIARAGYAQGKYVYTIKADSVKITNCDSAELILENHTQGVPGFLFNTGNGRTIFQRGAVSLGNGRYLVGSDTINLGANAWLQGGNAFGTTGILGTLDASPLDFYSNGIQGARLNSTGNLLLGTYADNGAKLQVVGSSYLKAGPDISFGLTTGSDNSGRSAVFGDSALTPADYAHHGLQINVFSSHAAVQSFSNVNQVIPASLSLNETGGDVMINTTADNGNILQVNGTSWFNGTMNMTGTVNALSGGNPANGLQVTPTLNATATSSILTGVLISPIFNTNGYGGVTSYGLNVVNGDSKFANNIYLNSYGDTSRIFSPNTIIYQSNADTGIQHIFADYISTPAAFTGTVVQIEGTSAAVSASMLKVLGRGDNPVLNAMANGYLGVGTLNPTAQLHTTGSIRFAGLTSDSTQTQVLVADANGNLYYRSAASLSATDMIRSSLTVNGPISAQRLTLSRQDWADYVFDSTYRLPSLAATDDYIHRRHHLPGIPSATEVKEKGVDMGDNQVALLKKIEELTLYAVDQDKRLNEQKETTAQQAKEIDIQNAKIEALEAKIELLTKLINTKIK